MLSEMYISIYNNPSTAVIEDSTDVNEDSATCHDDSGTYSIDIQNLCVSHNKENISLSEYSLFFIYFYVCKQFMFYNTKYNILALEYPTSKDLVKTTEECYYKALYYIGSSLSCLQYFKNDKDVNMVCIK